MTFKLRNDSNEEKLHLAYNYVEHTVDRENHGCGCTHKIGCTMIDMWKYTVDMMHHG